MSSKYIKIKRKMNKNIAILKYFNINSTINGANCRKMLVIYECVFIKIIGLLRE